MRRVPDKYLTKTVEVVNGFDIKRSWYMGGHIWDAIRLNDEGYLKISLARNAGKDHFGYKRDAVQAAKDFKGE